jgi:hypothetical protein
MADVGAARVLLARAPSFTVRSYDFAIFPSASDATGNLLLQYSGSAENSFRRAMLSSDTPMMLAPAAANLSLFTANSRAWTLHPLVYAEG